MNRVEQYESTEGTELLPTLLVCAEDVSKIRAVLKSVKGVTVELFLELLSQRLLLAAMEVSRVQGSLLGSSVLPQLLALLR